MEALREKLQQRYSNLRAAFRQLDVDGDASLSYAEFEDQLKKWMPQLPSSRANDVCRLLDANGDGMIDFEEFSKVLCTSRLITHPARLFSLHPACLSS